jgi:hypothetical protein
MEMAISKLELDHVSSRWLKDLLLSIMGEPGDREYKDLIIGSGETTGTDDGPGGPIFCSLAIKGKVDAAIVDFAAYQNPFSPDGPPLCCLILNDSRAGAVITNTAEVVKEALYQLAAEYAETLSSDDEYDTEDRRNQR